MTAQERDVLGSVVGDVFEGAAFIFTDLLDAGGQPDPSQWEAVGVQQCVKDKLVDPLRIRIEAHPRIEVCRAALDDHD